MTLSLEIFNCEWPLIKKWGHRHNKMNASLSMKVSNAFSWNKRRHFDLEFTEVCFEGSNWHTVSVEMKLIVYEKAQCYSTKQWIWSGTQLANVESCIHEYCSGKRDEAIALHLINILKKKYILISNTFLCKIHPMGLISLSFVHTGPEDVAALNFAWPAAGTTLTKSHTCFLPNCSVYYIKMTTEIVVAALRGLMRQ